MSEFEYTSEQECWVVQSILLESGVFTKGGYYMMNLADTKFCFSIRTKFWWTNDWIGGPYRFEEVFETIEDSDIKLRLLFYLDYFDDRK